MASYSCSFCGKQGDQVKQLIVGPSNSAICDECIYLSAGILGEKGFSGEPPSYLLPYRLLSRLWTAVAQLSTTVMALQGWMIPVEENQQPSEGDDARANLLKLLREIIEAAQNLATYHGLHITLEDK